MAQTTVLGAIPNEPGAQFRADVNACAQALATGSSGSSAPTVTYAYMWWVDTSTNPATVKIRNGANNAWITVGTADTTNLGLAPLASPTFTGTPAAPTAAADTNTTQLATTAFVIGQSYLKTSTASSTYAPLASPTFTGTVTVSDAAVASIATLTDGATITPDFSTACNFSVTLGGNRTLANPTNATAGQSGSIFIAQDGTGSRTLAYGSDWEFAGGSAPTLSTAASAVDRLDYIVRASGSIHAVLTKAYA